MTPEAEIFTVTFHPPPGHTLGRARHDDLRFNLAEIALDAVSGADDQQTIVVLPAGFLRVGTVARRDAMAADLLARSRRARCGIVFGIDVALDEGWAPLAPPPVSFAYACQSGRPVAWPMQQVKPSGRSAILGVERCFDLCGVRVGVLIAGELFLPVARAMVKRGRPGVVFVLTHGVVNDRWHPALRALDALAPTMVVGQAAGRHPLLWAMPPPGWSRDAVASTSEMTISRYRGAPTLQERA